MSIRNLLNKLYFINKSFSYKHFYKSIKYFISHNFYKEEYDVVFVYHNHFNRGGNGENMFFEPFISTCKEHDINYKVFEETSLDGKFSMYPRNKDAIPLDFLTLVQFILRKIFSSNRIDYSNYDNFYKREVKVSKVLKTIFFRQFKSKIYIVLAHNNVELWRVVDPKSIIIDYQHGMIWNGHDNILVNSMPAEIKVYNDLTIMLYGKGFKQLLLENDKTNFFNDKNTIDIGYYLPISPLNKKLNNKVILYTLQNVDLESNTEYYNMIKNLLYDNKEFLEKNGYKVLIKNHPRYNRNDKLTFDEDLSFVSFVDDNILIDDLVDKVSIHLTSKSTTTFDLALKGIPTIFTDMLDVRSPRDMFINQYNYPFENYIMKDVKELESVLLNLENENIFNETSIEVYNWARKFYQDFDNNKIIKLLKSGTRNGL